MLNYKTFDVVCSQESKLSAAEIRMLQWIIGHERNIGLQVQVLERKLG